MILGCRDMRPTRMGPNLETLKSLSGSGARNGLIALALTVSA